MKTILKKIVEDKRIELQEQKRKIPLKILKEQISNLPPTRNFKAAIKGQNLSLIAEIKKASPSVGVIREGFDPAELAKTYELNGASAISVLTEKKYFSGDLNYLKVVKEITAVPVLRKDFIFDEYQIYESRVAGADAILLIVSILDDETLAKLLDLTKKLGLDALVETHTEREIERALKNGAEIIGINNRNLDTFEVNLVNSVNLLHLIPLNKVVVSESGVHDRKDMIILKNSGVDAALVGEAIVRSEDVGKKIRELLGKHQVKRV